MRRFYFTLLACFTFAAFCRPCPAQLEPLDSGLFPIPPEIEDNVAFWTDVFANYTSEDVVLHDEDYPSVVYLVLNFSELRRQGLAEPVYRERRRSELQKAEQHVRTQLLALAAGNPLPPDEQERFETLFAKVPGGREKYRLATDRFRTQTGLKDRFEEAIRRSGLYIRTMEDIFRRRGLPWELSRLPLVESMFHLGARSKVGAGGIWQFMPSTGRYYLNMGLEVDERFDPLLATEGAARLLEENYQKLGNWPLAITAYNYGRNGLLRAVNNLGTRDYGTIVRRHQSRTFGFASKNFYSEFLAAAAIYENRGHYFPGIEPHPPLAFDVFTAEHFYPVVELAQAATIPLDEIRNLNPAISSQVWDGDLLLPRGYQLRLPRGRGTAFETLYAGLPDEKKSPHQAISRYRVRKGDTLSRIAFQNGTSVASIQQANGLRSAHEIRVGQVLLIPPRKGSWRPGTTTAKAEATQASRSTSSDKSQEGTRRHVVRPGETLIKIARLYDTTVSAIQRVNRITSHVIYPQQVLIIP